MTCSAVGVDNESAVCQDPNIWFQLTLLLMFLPSSSKRDITQLYEPDLAVSGVKACFWEPMSVFLFFLFFVLWFHVNTRRVSIFKQWLTSGVLLIYCRPAGYQMILWISRSFLRLFICHSQEVWHAAPPDWSHFLKIIQCWVEGKAFLCMLRLKTRRTCF